MPVTSLSEWPTRNLTMSFPTTYRKILDHKSCPHHPRHEDHIGGISCSSKPMFHLCWSFALALIRGKLEEHGLCATKLYEINQKHRTAVQAFESYFRQPTLSQNLWELSSIRRRVALSVQVTAFDFLHQSVSRQTCTVWLLWARKAFSRLLSDFD